MTLLVKKEILDKLTKSKKKKSVKVIKPGFDLYGFIGDHIIWKFDGQFPLISVEEEVEMFLKGE
jgi:hypothetical protein